jgi:putative nucleotidyltransferase with HDIG domain
MPENLPSLQKIKVLMEKIARRNGISKQAKDTWRHSRAIFHFAEEIAKCAIKNGFRVNLKFLKIACFTHDIGRMVTGSRATEELKNPIYHGIEGYKICKKAGFKEKLARVCQRHTGGTGLPKSENIKYRIARKDTFAETLEEKILGYADFRTFGIDGVPKIVSFQKAYNRFKKYPGAEQRIKKLQKFIKKITGRKIK